MSPKTRTRVETSRAHVEIVPRRGPGLWRLAVLASALAFVGVNSFAAQVFPQAVGAVNDRPTLIDPAPYAFSIWGPIFLGLLAYAVYQLTPAGRRRTGVARARTPLLVSFVAGALWPAAVGYGQWPVALGLIVVMLAGAAVGRVRLGRGGASLAERLFARWPVGLYMGWLSLATLLSVTSVLQYDLGLGPTGLAALPWAVGGVAIAGLLGAFFAWKRMAFASLAIAWGLAAVAIDQGLFAITAAVFAAVGAMLVAGVIGYGADAA